MEKPIFSVLTWNFNKYEIFRELKPEVINKDAEYVYVTDDKSIKSKTWKVVYIDRELLGMSPIEMSYYIRYNPFRFVNSDIVFKMDGSVELNVDVTPLIQKYIDGGYDGSVMIHQERNTLLQEYLIWTYLTIIKPPQIEKCIKFISNENYDIMNYKGLYLATVGIQTNTNFTRIWNQMTYWLCKYLAEPTGGIERIDQIIQSFTLNKYFSDKKIMPLDPNMLCGGEFNWYAHYTGELRNVKQIAEPYLFNEKCEPIRILYL